MKNNVRNVSLNFRATKEEADRIKSNAKEAKMPQSEYLRKCSLNQNIQPIVNGKEISESIGLLHGKMQNYRQDVINHFEKIREFVDNIKELATMNHSPSAEILALELSGINANLSVIMSNYEREEQEVEKSVMALVAPINETDTTLGAHGMPRDASGNSRGTSASRHGTTANRPNWSRRS